MIRACSVFSVRVKFNTDFSFSEIRRLYWIKIINAYTQREKESGRIHERKFRVNKTNFGILFVVIYIYIYKVFKVNPYLKYFGRCLHQFLYKCIYIYAYIYIYIYLYTHTYWRLVTSGRQSNVPILLITPMALRKHASYGRPVAKFTHCKC